MKANYLKNTHLSIETLPFGTWPCLLLLAITYSIISPITADRVAAATYVVDQAVPGAADTNPGTERKPFKTVQHAADAAQAGDTIFVMEGQYDERVKVKTGGTES